MNNANILINTDIINGLFNQSKSISSKYFYDQAGDKIFQEIMDLPEYYLTRAEYDILTTQSDKIASYLNKDSFRILEFGAGDGVKTKILVNHLIQKGKKFTYTPIDISANAIDLLQANFSDLKGDFSLKPYIGDYFEALDNFNEANEEKLIMLLGSNIGNFTPTEATNFLSLINERLNYGDKLLMGVDLVKNPIVIKNAYNDSKGITERFNKNLLVRINTELGANFDVDNFDFYASYNPNSGSVKSYLVSKKKQDVYLKETDEVIHFDQWEPVFTEVSQKYTINQLDDLAESAGFKVLDKLYDKNKYFTDVIWEKA